jgi:hypothetical protein
VFRLILIILLVLYSTTTLGRGPATATGELALYVHAPRTSSEQTLFGKELFADIHTTEHSALFVRGYHDDESWIATLGLETCLFDDALKIGIAGGAAGHDEELNPAISPSIYYHTRRTEILLLAEYRVGGRHHSFYRGYAQHQIFKNLVLGAYGESHVGWGPSAGIKVTEHVTIWATLPVSERPQYDERIEFLFGARIQF